jgi:hypothetical protein
VLTSDGLEDDVGPAVIHEAFPHSRIERGSRVVSYFHPEWGHVMSARTSSTGRVTYEAGEGLCDEALDVLRVGIEEAASPVWEVWRDPLFSIDQVNGYWRRGDDWQIVPAPPGAPRPGFTHADHPFILEYKVRSSSNFTVALSRRMRRLWELHLLLSLLLRRGVTREHPEVQHHWVILPEASVEGFHTVYANTGYIVGEGFVNKGPSLTEPEPHLSPLTVTPATEYYSWERVVPDEMEIPDCIDGFFDRVDASSATCRDQLFRAAYWYDMAYRVWPASKALSLVSAVTAVEVLLPDQVQHPCPDCGANHAITGKGPTAMFAEFVERYASSENTEARKKVYGLRSQLVHGSDLHAMDTPRVWGALLPAAEDHRSLHDAAFAVARTAIRNWFLAGDDD